MLSASKSGSGLATGYNLTRSLRFRASATAYLNRTPASASNRKTWTWSGWVKLGLVSSFSTLFGTGGTTDSTRLIAQFNSTGTLNIDVYTVNLRVSNAVFRDPSAWYHIVIVFDSTNATATNRLRVYSNNVELTWSTNNAVTLNADYGINNNTSHAIGYDITNTGRYFDGEMTEVNFIDGQALTPSSFGSTNALTGVWQPAAYTGTYGTNGFYLPFTDNSALTTASNAGLGKDFSGNANYFVTNNISITAGVTYDSMTDVPTLTSATAANFCVGNPLYVPSTNSQMSSRYANLDWGQANTNVNCSMASTFAMPTSKWYWEVTVGAALTQAGLGMQNTTNTAWRGGGTVLYLSGGNKQIGGGTATSYGASYTTGDIIGFAYNGDTGELTCYKNNTSQGIIYSNGTGSSWLPCIHDDNAGAGVTYYHSLNFGQRPFSYTPPTGFVALNTYNLPTSTIVKGNTVMDATLYTGTLLSNAVTNAASFKPDLVWVKSRSAATENRLTDSVRGVTKALVSSATAAESTDTQGLTAFGSAGFTVGTNTDYNNLAATYVGWQWQAGQGSTSSNTNGSITSTVSVNASAGFSIVSYTGTGAAATVGHGLGVTPSVIICKNRSASGAWHSYFSAISGMQNGYIVLNTSDAFFTPNTTVWNGVQPTSTVFSIGTDSGVNGSGNAQIAYCWTPIAGYSAFGSYTGNGSTDGPFVYTGFRPKFVLIKASGLNESWYIYDSTRNTYNVVDLELNPNNSGAEATFTTLDFLSNGFKLRTTNSAFNSSGATYIYACFSENPFKNALAR